LVSFTDTLCLYGGYRYATLIAGEGYDVIRSFADDRTQDVFEGRRPRGIPAQILKAARRKLNYLDAATSLDALKAPPGNKLHPLLG
jgi:plasmid maintenance system killer protein